MSMLFSSANSTASCMLKSSFPSWMSWSIRGELGPTGIVVLRRAESDRHDWRGCLGGRSLRSLRRFLPEGRGNGPSHERYGQYGGQQRSSIQRLHSAPYPQDLSPKGLNLYVLNSVKRSQNGICFKKLTVLRSRLKSESFAATRRARSSFHPGAAPRRPREESSLAGALFLDNAEGGG